MSETARRRKKNVVLGRINPESGSIKIMMIRRTVGEKGAANCDA